MADRDYVAILTRAIIDADHRLKEPRLRAEAMDDIAALRDLAARVQAYIVACNALPCAGDLTDLDLQNTLREECETTELALLATLRGEREGA